MSRSLRRIIAKALTFLAVALVIIGLIVALASPVGSLTLLGLTMSYATWGWVTVGVGCLAFTIGYAVEPGAAREALAVVSGAVSSVVDAVASSIPGWIWLAGAGVALLFLTKD